jgi:hypothetical protein
MAVDPIAYADPAAQVRQQRFDALQVKWIGSLIFIVVGLGWLIIKTHVSREPELPNRPFTKADVPLLKEKVKSLKSDADSMASIYPHLNNRAEAKTANEAWDEVYYTPEVFPAAQSLHHIQYARLLQLRPDLAEHTKAKQAYEDGRYAIANNPAITDKDAAYDALKDRIGPEVKDPEYSRNAKQATDILATLVGDPELDQAEDAYEQACATAILKRHPELSAYFHDLANRDEAYHQFMAQANSLSRQITVLENSADPAQTANPVSSQSQAASSSSTPSLPQTSTPSSSPLVPHAAVRYGVTVGDAVDISAVTPPIALHRAKLTAMDNDQLTVRNGSDTFTVHWPDLIQLKKSH